MQYAETGTGITFQKKVFMIANIPEELFLAFRIALSTIKDRCIMSQKAHFMRKMIQYLGLSLAIVIKISRIPLPDWFYTSIFIVAYCKFSIYFIF